MPPRPRPKRRVPGAPTAGEPPHRAPPGAHHAGPVEAIMGGLPPHVEPTGSFSAHEQADPRDEILASFSTASSLDPMVRLEMQGQRLRDAKRRLRDPGSPRRLRLAAAGLLGLVALPVVLMIVAFAVAQIASLFD